MPTGRFRSPKTEEEEIALLSEAVPKNTKYNTKWAVHVSTAWENTRMNQINATENTRRKRTSVNRCPAVGTCQSPT